MNLALLFLLPDKLHHKLMFICPTCNCQTFTPTTTDLTTLRCTHCGDIHNAENAEFEILASPQSPYAPAPGHKPGTYFPKAW